MMEQASLKNFLDKSTVNKETFQLIYCYVCSNNTMELTKEYDLNVSDTQHNVSPI